MVLVLAGAAAGTASNSLVAVSQDAEPSASGAGQPLGIVVSARLVEPQKRLMAAVLQTVVDDCRGTVCRRAAGHGIRTDLRGVRRATAYVASTDRAWPFSFENLCDSLGLDAGWFRQKLRKEEHGI